MILLKSLFPADYNSHKIPQAYIYQQIWTQIFKILRIFLLQIACFLLGQHVHGSLRGAINGMVPQGSLAGLRRYVHDATRDISLDHVSRDHLRDIHHRLDVYVKTQVEFFLGGVQEELQLCNGSIVHQKIHRQNALNCLSSSVPVTKVDADGLDTRILCAKLVQVLLCLGQSYHLSLILGQAECQLPADACNSLTFDMLRGESYVLV